MLVLHDAREQDKVRLRLGIVSDEESEEEKDRGSDALVDDGFVGDFAITGEPTNLQVGVQAKGVLAMRLGRQRPRRARRHARGSGTTRSSRRLRCFAASSRYRLRGRAPSSSTGHRSTSAGSGRRRTEQGAGQLRDGRRRALPSRTGPRGDPRAGRGPARHHACSRPSADRPRWSRRTRPFVLGLCEATSPHHPERVMSVGRDGASDAVSFLSVGVPAVEFGPVGDGHHGPEEWVSVASLRSYRQALQGFVGDFPGLVPRGRGVRLMTPAEEARTRQGREPRPAGRATSEDRSPLRARLREDELTTSSPRGRSRGGPRARRRTRRRSRATRTRRTTRSRGRGARGRGGDSRRSSTPRPRSGTASRTPSGTPSEPTRDRLGPLRGSPRASRRSAARRSPRASRPLGATSASRSGPGS